MAGQQSGREKFLVKTLAWLFGLIAGAVLLINLLVPQKELEGPAAPPSAMTPAAPPKREPNSPHVTRAMFGDDKWPFSVDRGDIDCQFVVKDGDTKMVLTFETDDYRFIALNYAAIQEKAGKDHRTSPLYIEGKPMLYINREAQDYCREKYPEFYRKAKP